MKNYFKTFGIMFIVAFTIILGNCKCASANPVCPDRITYYQGEKIKVNYYCAGFGDHAWIGCVNIDTDKIYKPTDIKGMTWIEEPSGDVEFEVPEKAGNYKIVVYPGDRNGFTYANRFFATEHEFKVSSQHIDISLNKSTDNLNVGETTNLVATTTPSEVVKRINDWTDETTTPSAVKVEWKSSDESVATVDSNGKVTGLKEGQSTITATMIDGNEVSKTCVVTVTNKISLEMPDGNKYSLTNSQVKDFIEWYNNRETNTSDKSTYKFNKSSLDTNN